MQLSICASGCVICASARARASDSSVVRGQSWWGVSHSVTVTATATVGEVSEESGVRTLIKSPEWVGVSSQTGKKVECVHLPSVIVGNLYCRWKNYISTLRICSFKARIHCKLGCIIKIVWLPVDEPKKRVWWGECRTTHKSHERWVCKWMVYRKRMLKKRCNISGRTVHVARWSFAYNIPCREFGIVVSKQSKHHFLTQWQYVPTMRFNPIGSQKVILRCTNYAVRLKLKISWVR